MTDVLSEHKNIAVLFLQQAAKTPQSPAVIDDKQSVTYEQLAGMASRVARDIMNKTGPAAAQICILAVHDVSAVAAMLGVLMAGKCFVPMLPQENDVYLRYLWENSEASLIICSPEESKRAAAICGDDRRVVVCDMISDKTDIFDPSPCINNPESISAVMYTSGSTGQPKGVMTTGESIFNRAMQHIELAKVVSYDKQASVVPWQFSSSFPDIYAPLLTGASLYMYDIHRQGIERLGRWIQNNKTALLKLPADLVRRFVQNVSAEMLTSVRYYYSGGGIKVKDAKLLFEVLPENAVLTHGFASTETNLVTVKEWRRSDSIFQETKAPFILPAGYPILGKDIQIVDDQRRPVATGEEGELVVISHQIFLGYWRHPQMTTQHLQELPDGRRVFYTSDLGRIREDGCLEIIGRKGNRVKIRGLRIDLGAAESLFCSLPYVRSAAAVSSASSVREAQLVAYLEIAAGETITATRLREDLTKIVPDYMIPSRFIMMEALPRTASGKIDQKSLPVPGKERPVLANPYVPPQSAMEKILADIWAEVLDIDQVGIDDNFLELGGDSLLTLEMEMKLEQTFGNKQQIGSLVQMPTIAQMAKVIEAPEMMDKAALDMSVPLRSRIKHLRQRLKRGDINAPLWMEPFLPSYNFLFRLQKFWLSSSLVRYLLKDKIAIFKRWLALTGQTDDSGKLTLRYLMANTWAVARNVLISQNKSSKRWYTTVGWNYVLRAREMGRGVIIVIPHTHLFLTRMRNKFALEAFPESYHLIQSGLSPGKAAKTIGLAGRLKEARDVLRRGGAVWIVGDGQQGKEKLVLTHYGRRFPFRAGAAELSLQTGAPLIPAFPFLKNDGCVEVEFYAPLGTVNEGAQTVCADKILRQYAEIYLDIWPRMLPNFRTGRLRRRLKDVIPLRERFDERLTAT